MDRQLGACPASLAKALRKERLDPSLLSREDASRTLLTVIKTTDGAEYSVWTATLLGVTRRPFTEPVSASKVPALDLFVACLNDDAPDSVTANGLTHLIETACYLAAFGVVRALPHYLQDKPSPYATARIVASVVQHAPQLTETQFHFARFLSADLTCQWQATEFLDAFRDAFRDGAPGVERRHVLEWLKSHPHEDGLHKFMALAVNLCNGSCVRGDMRFIEVIGELDDDADLLAILQNTAGSQEVCETCLGAFCKQVLRSDWS